MASIGTDKRGSRYIQFEDRNRERRTLRLGKVSQRDAEVARLRVEKLVSAQILGNAPDAETSRWLAEVGEKLSAKLAKLGLIENRNSSTLGAFLAEYKASRHDVKASTRAAWGSTHESLVDYFGERKPLRGITEGDAKGWRRSVAIGRAENTVRKMTAIAKTLFNAAVDFRLIERNPFNGLPSAMVENTARMHFITAETAAAVIEACPTTEWKLIVALARWGGLRCPSEVFELRWGDILWDKNRFKVRCVKTEHHVGHEIRFVPIFPELAPYLEQAFEEAPEGAVYVIERSRDSATNLRTQLTRYIERAGIVPWPKLFQNLRSTRETELADRFNVKQVCAWIGNSPQVAMKHYLQVTDDHFDQAAGKSAANALQHDAAPKESDDSDSSENVENAAEFSPVPSSAFQSVGDTRLELVTSTV